MLLSFILLFSSFPFSFFPRLRRSRITASSRVSDDRNPELSHSHSLTDTHTHTFSLSHTHTRSLTVFPCFFNQRAYYVVSETSSVTNRCITLSLCPSPTRGPCVQFVSLRRETEHGVRSVVCMCLLLSLAPPVMFCFSSVRVISAADDRSRGTRFSRGTNERFSHARRLAHL